MLDRAAYDALRRRNQEEQAEGAAELRCALLALPASERARLLATQPHLLARLPSADMRTDILLAGATLSAGAETEVRSAVATLPAHPGNLPAVITQALVPAVVSPTGIVAPPKWQRTGTGIVTPRRRVTHPLARAWMFLGRPLQATLLATVVALGVTGWHANRASSPAHVPLPVDRKHAATWPACADGLRPRTDWCVYTVTRSLTWGDALSRLKASETERAALAAVNAPLLDADEPWVPRTALVVWRGRTP